jgi:predicted peptidase
MPTLWAAAIPLCGGGDPSAIAVARHVSIWAFHGDKDPTVPVARTKELIAALEAAGGHPKFTEYKDAHPMDAADKAYHEPELLSWLFEKKCSR